ncbi:MAG: hypothetical protein V3V01_13575 [Acidimicrobiales bacterium]
MTTTSRRESVRSGSTRFDRRTSTRAIETSSTTAAKTVLEIHRVISNSLDLPVDRQLLDTNPAKRARPTRRAARSSVPAIWTASQLGEFLEVTKTKRLYPALHLVAHTGIRRRRTRRTESGQLRHRVGEPIDSAHTTSHLWRDRRSTSQDPHKPAPHRPRLEHGRRSHALATPSPPRGHQRGVDHTDVLEPAPLSTIA